MNSIMNEYGVIGSLLIDSSLFPEAAGLPDDMFSSVPLQEIFRAMRRQYEESGSFDALTIRAEAGRNCTDVTDKLLTGLDRRDADYRKSRRVHIGGQRGSARTFPAKDWR